MSAEPLTAQPVTVLAPASPQAARWVFATAPTYAPPCASKGQKLDCQRSQSPTQPHSCCAAARPDCSTAHASPPDTLLRAHLAEVATDASAVLNTARTPDRPVFLPRTVYARSSIHTSPHRAHRYRPENPQQMNCAAVPS